MAIPLGWKKRRAFRDVRIQGLTGRDRAARQAAWGRHIETTAGEKGYDRGDTRHEPSTKEAV